jgi:hypothetical protein
MLFVSGPARPRYADLNGIESSRDIALWRPSLDMCHRIFCNGSQARAIGQHILQNMRKSVDVAAWKNEVWCNRSDKIMRCADTIAHHDRARTTHGFINDHGERFILRGQNHKISGSVDSGEMGLVYEPKEADARSDAKGCRFGFERRAKWSFADVK